MAQGETLPWTFRVILARIEPNQQSALAVWFVWKLEE